MSDFQVSHNALQGFRRLTKFRGSDSDAIQAIISNVERAKAYDQVFNDDPEPGQAPAQHYFYGNLGYVVTLSSKTVVRVYDLAKEAERRKHKKR